MRNPNAAPSYGVYQPLPLGTETTPVLEVLSQPPHPSDVDPIGFRIESGPNHIDRIPESAQYIDRRLRDEPDTTDNSSDMRTARLQSLFLKARLRASLLLTPTTLGTFPDAADPAPVTKILDDQTTILQ